MSIPGDKTKKVWDTAYGPDPLLGRVNQLNMPLPQKLLPPPKPAVMQTFFPAATYASQVSNRPPFFVPSSIIPQQLPGISVRDSKVVGTPVEKKLRNSY